jgi:hypothetical protein
MLRFSCAAGALAIGWTHLNPTGWIRVANIERMFYHVLEARLMSSGEERWRGVILGAATRPPRVLQALTPVLRLRGTTRAVLADCEDGNRYVIKGRQVMRPLIADHIVGRLSALIGGPIPAVELINVPAELVQPRSFFEHFEPGIGHGSLYLAGCRDSRWILYPDDPGNPERFAVLSVLFGWVDPEDRQFLYNSTSPHRVYSADHGRFLAGSTDWTADSLRGASAATLDEWFMTEVRMGRSMLKDAVQRLARVTDSEIAQAVSGLPEEWGITLDERMALAAYLARRRDDLLAEFDAQ